MSTTVTYKGQTLTTVENQTKTLQTAGTWVEGDFTLTDVTQGGGGYDVQEIAFNREPSGAVTLVAELSNIWTFGEAFAFANKPITSVTFDATPAPNTVNVECGNQQFRGTRITQITDASFVGFNGASFVPYSAFQEMKLLTTVDTAVLWNFKGYGSCFMNDSALARISIQNAYGDTASGVCQGCNALEYADLGSINKMQGNAFRQNYKLQTLILRNTAVVNLNVAPATAFYQTPFLGYNSLTADLYVPQALISDYQNATNWSTLLSNGYTTIHAIEGSEYEL